MALGRKLLLEQVHFAVIYFQKTCHVFGLHLCNKEFTQCPDYLKTFEIQVFALVCQRQ